MNPITYVGRQVRFVGRFFYWLLAPSTKGLKTKIIKEDEPGIFVANPVFVMKRMWWAFAPEHFNIAYIIPKESVVAKLLEGLDDDTDWAKKLITDVREVTSQMGERGVDWDIVNFGNSDFIAVMTVDPTWMVSARLCEINLSLIKVIFSNFIDYRPGSEFEPKK